MRLCYSCKHFEFNPGSPGYSDMTPGCETSLSCKKHVWEAYDCGYGGEGLASKLEYAKECEKYKDADWVKKGKERV